MLTGKGSNQSYIDSTTYQIVIVEDSGRTQTKAFAGGTLAITNHAANMFIDGSGGADSLTNTADSVTNVTIDSGGGNDTIINDGKENVTITTGEGSDVISIGTNVESFSVTDDFSGADKIVFAGGSIASLTTTADNVVIATVGEQVVSIEGFPHGASGDATWNRNTETNVAGYAKAIYSAAVSGDKSAIVVNAEGQGAPLMEIGGIVNPESISTDETNKIVSIPFSSDVMSTDGASILSNSGGYAVSLTSGNNVSKFYGSELGDSIINDGNAGRTIYGGAGNDSLVNKGIQNTLEGGAGNDSLNGGDGKDTLSGGTGNDKLLGGAGNDSLSGGDGKDSLWGGAVDDKLYGGSGDDIFIYSPAKAPIPFSTTRAAIC